MIRVGLSGSTGRMGEEITLLLKKQKDFVLVKSFSSTNTIKDFDPTQVDLIIDFSLPEAFYEVHEWCSQFKKPLLSGTTGEGLIEFVNTQLPEFPFMYSGNYSLGISIFLHSIKNFKALGENLKVELTDIHHVKKLDSPSGTALKIKKEVEESFLNTKVEIESIREGSVFGVHEIKVSTKEEALSIKHEALHRSVFAKGALNASGWLVQQKPGLYTLEDFLNNVI